LESGNSDLSYFFQPKDLADDLFQEWALAVGCPQRTGSLPCLQSKSATNFTNPPIWKYFGRSPFYAFFPVGPVIDGTEHGLRDVPINLVKAGQFHKVPILLGGNKDDGSIFESIVTSIIP